MMLVEQTTVPREVLPVTEFRDHLRLGTGFADDGVQDIVLESYLRAAIAAIESRTGKVLLQRGFLWSLTAWRESRSQTLPVAPVVALTSITLTDQNSAEIVVDEGGYRLMKDGHAPKVQAIGRALPSIPNHGTADVAFDAGYGATWGDVPPDLGQAVFLLAAHYYENRSLVAGGETPMPFGVSLLIDRYRRVRLFGEGSK
ncbi:MAG: head-tail connector protein [Pseudomonadota bacterium]